MAKTRPTVVPRASELLKPTEPPMSARDRWRRYGNGRTKAVVKALRQLAKTNTKSYERLPNEIDAIEILLEDELRRTISELRRGTETLPTVQDIF